MEVLENSLDSEIWHACAGGMVQMPKVNSKVYYFPQGHAEHALAKVDFGGFTKIPSSVLCRVSSVMFLADRDTDEVYAKMSLVPVGMQGCYDGDDDERVLGIDRSEKPITFAKTLTQSDANNGGGFSVPRYCAETIFPRLDYTADPPLQNLVAKDVHGQVWKFRHIYRGTPRRHLLTTGWSAFVNQKKLVAGDSVVFLRAENGEICVGVRRAKRGNGNGGNEISSGWNSNGIGSFSGFSSFGKEDENKSMNQSGGNGNLGEFGRVRPEAVVEAAYLAANGQPFEVVYYPRVSTPEFCVKASSVGAAMRIQWCPGMRFKMPFETEDSSRISWFMGTVAAVHFADPIRWPSPWRMLQVTWDEQDLLPNVKSVSPWLVELVSNVPSLNLTPFLHPRKKLRVPNPPDFALDGHFSMPSFSGNPHGPNSPLSCQLDNITVGIQGARHAQIGVPFLDFHLSNKVQFEPLYPSFNPPARISRSKTEEGDENENISCFLSIGNSSHKQNKIVKRPQFVLFGQTIVTEQQLSSDESDDGVSEVASGQVAENFAPEGRSLIQKKPSVPFLLKPGSRAPELGLDYAHCKVFLGSEDIGQILDLSVLASYDDLYRRLEHMLGIEKLDMLGDVFYRDAMGVCKQIGDEPFSKFTKSAKRLTIFMKSTGNSAERKLITGLPRVEHGINSTGPFSIFV